MKLLTRRSVLIEEEEVEGSSYLADADADADSDEARSLRPLQAAACTHRVAFATLRNGMASDYSLKTFRNRIDHCHCAPDRSQRAKCSGQTRTLRRIACEKSLFACIKLWRQEKGSRSSGC